MRRRIPESRRPGHLPANTRARALRGESRPQGRSTRNGMAAGSLETSYFVSFSAAFSMALGGTPSARVRRSSVATVGLRTPRSMPET